MKKIISLLAAVIVCIFIYNPTAKASTYGVVEGGTYRTLVPVRLVSETFNASVDWYASSKTVYINNEYSLTLGSKNIYKNGKLFKTMDTAPKLIHSSVYIPVRDIADVLGASIHWEQSTKQVSYRVDGKLYTLQTYPEADVVKPKVSSANRSFLMNGKTINAKVVSINLLAPNTSLEVELAKNTLGATDKLANIARSHNAVAAINGNYFDAYTNGVTLRTVYNGIAMDGKIVKYFDQSFPVFFYRYDGSAGILPGAAFKAEFDKGTIKEGLQIGPTLMRGGEIWVNPAAEGSKDPKILTMSATRSAVGILPNRQLVFLTVPSAKITELAHVMKSLGAIDAMNFDGGASSGLYVNGSYLTTPGRDIAVGLLVK